jgi:hypothetical protein
MATRKQLPTKRNPIAKAVRGLRVKIRPSAKVYKRKERTQ